jgi:hypothetical protein
MAKTAFYTRRIRSRAYLGRQASHFIMATAIDSAPVKPDQKMTQKSFVETYKVAHALCDRLVDFYNKNKRFAQPGRLGGDSRIDKSMKDSMDLGVPMNVYYYFEPFFQTLLKHVDEYVQKYYYDLGGSNIGPLGVNEMSNIQWYPKGGGYPATHCERDKLFFCNRALVWMMYLTDTPGGGTEFPHQNLVTDCIKGDLLIWPTDLTHMHRGVVSKTHEKMIFTGWINYVSPEAVQGNAPAGERQPV